MAEEKPEKNERSVKTEKAKKVQDSPEHREKSDASPSADKGNPARAKEKAQDPAAISPTADADKSKKEEPEKEKVKKIRKPVPAHCIAHVKATFNNTLVTITDPQGQVVSRSSCGAIGFKGSRKSTPYAAGLAAEAAAKDALSRGVRKVDVRVKGPGAGRETAIRSLKHAGLEILSIRDVSPIPHNGCRPPKQRRI